MNKEGVRSKPGARFQPAPRIIQNHLAWSPSKLLQLLREALSKCIQDFLPTTEGILNP
jgi:hypothetical protein